MAFKGERQSIFEEGLGDAGIDHEHVPCDAEILLGPLALKLSIEGQQESFW